MKTVFEISAGGVIFKKENNDISVAIIRVGNRYALPKGLVEKGESLEHTAVREVKEETGLEGKLLGLIDKIDYWFFWKNEKGEKVRHHKKVYFYLLEFVKGSTEKHDFEVDEVLWLSPGEALEKLSYKSEKEILKKAIQKIKELK